MTKAAQNVLFLVTGMTPAIITETIWALACDPALEEDQWIPDRVEVLSTEHGLNQIRSRLLENKAIDQMKQDFPQLSNMVFDDNCMHSIKDGKNQTEALIDLKTPEDNEFAANQINEHIRQLTQDENTCLHVSIAGGRKTMGFYAGYALSLHGRAQDRMSHVLVDDKFENIPGFLYPTPKASYVTDRDGRVWDASKAQVWLAAIPFVRMKDAIKKDHSIANVSFSEAVHNINAANQDIEIILDLPQKTLTLPQQQRSITLPPREFSFMCMFANARQNKQLGFKTPGGNLNDKDLPSDEVAYIGQISQAFKHFYTQLRDEDYVGERHIDVGKKYFEQAKTGLKKTLRKELGLELAARIEIIQDKPGQPFYLDVPADTITIIDGIK